MINAIFAEFLVTVAHSSVADFHQLIEDDGSFCGAMEIVLGEFGICVEHLHDPIEQTSYNWVSVLHSEAYKAFGMLPGVTKSQGPIVTGIRNVLLALQYQGTFDNSVYHPSWKVMTFETMKECCDTQTAILAEKVVAHLQRLCGNIS